MKAPSLPPLADLKEPAALADRRADAKLRQACADFEAIVLKQLLSAMRRTIPKSGLLDGGHAGSLYQSMHDDAVTTSLAHGKGMGFGEVLYRQLSGQTRPTIAGR